MKREVLCTISALPYRQPIPVYGFRFGSGDETLAVMGAIRGDEFQQMYTAARLIQRLEKLSGNGRASVKSKPKPNIIMLIIAVTLIIDMKNSISPYILTLIRLTAVITIRHTNAATQCGRSGNQ